jgi:hypothetical protein
MKVKLTALCIAASIFFIACDPEGPYADQHVQDVVSPTATKLVMAGPGDPCTIDCEPGGSNCQTRYEDLGLACDNVCVTRQQLDTIRILLS